MHAPEWREYSVNRLTGCARAVRRDVAGGDSESADEAVQRGVTAAPCGDTSHSISAEQRTLFKVASSD